MANFKLWIVLLVITVVTTAATSQSLVAPRIIGGAPIDTLSRFPHHVTIQKDASCTNDAVTTCGGSIISSRWVLTSARCVDGCPRLRLNFERLYSNDTVGSWTMVLNSDAVHVYPTYFDDIAMVKLPANLIFSDKVKPVAISSKPLSQLEGKLAVMPGFDANSLNNTEEYIPLEKQQLTYAMLNVLPNTQCKQSIWYTPFDEYTQLCTLGWANIPNNPCVTDYGSGLLSGWPAKTELIGIFASTSWNCYSSYPSVYVNIAKYTWWIQSLLWQ